MNHHLGEALTGTENAIKWKLWEAASRLFMKRGQFRKAKAAIEKSCIEALPTSLQQACLNYAKFYEMSEDLDNALRIIKFAQDQPKKENQWQIHFQSLMMLVRNGKFQEAEEQVLKLLEKFAFTGRLWSVLI